MRLETIPPEDYARLVLPHSHTAWSARRDLSTYVSDTMEIARSRFGKRHYRTVGLFDRRSLLASFKRYDRTMHDDGGQRLRAMGIGAVFTPPALRGRGYATAMVASALDHARRDGYDLAFLFSDIRPHLYAAIGFRELPSHQISLRADTLSSRRLTVTRIADNDWNAVERCCELSMLGHAGFERTRLVWELIRMRMRHRAEHPTGQLANLAIRRGRAIHAYVLGVRVPDRDAYFVDEFGFAGDEAAALVPALLRAAAGDLRRVVGWLPPSGARDILPRATVRKRRDAILMAAPLSTQGKQLIATLSRRGAGDCCWATDHI